ncbi:hypothetical protein BpHYR1_031804 [Brachionus plicatilis]|uniref:Uncharacterized protein n=1 Tax=Brachionus plicatilis TaxID=10195 RepID=A0A3M7PV77_BRAPC|nr:hypothetical protein BpHYR1_031804 [Brachionus plicatilis]
MILTGLKPRANPKPFEVACAASATKRSLHLWLTNVRLPYFAEYKRVPEERKNQKRRLYSSKKSFFYFFEYKQVQFAFFIRIEAGDDVNFFEYKRPAFIQDPLIFGEILILLFKIHKCEKKKNFPTVLKYRTEFELISNLISFRS